MKHYKPIAGFMLALLFTGVLLAQDDGGDFGPGYIGGEELPVNRIELRFLSVQGQTPDIEGNLIPGSDINPQPVVVGQDTHRVHTHLFKFPERDTLYIVEVPGQNPIIWGHPGHVAIRILPFPGHRFTAVDISDSVDDPRLYVSVIGKSIFTEVPDTVLLAPQGVYAPDVYEHVILSSEARPDCTDKGFIYYGLRFWHTSGARWSVKFQDSTYVFGDSLVSPTPLIPVPGYKVSSLSVNSYLAFIGLDRDGSVQPPDSGVVSGVNLVADSLCNGPFVKDEEGVWEKLLRSPPASSDVLFVAGPIDGSALLFKNDAHTDYWKVNAQIILSEELVAGQKYVVQYQFDHPVDENDTFFARVAMVEHPHTTQAFEPLALPADTSGTVRFTFTAKQDGMVRLQFQGGRLHELFVDNVETRALVADSSQSEPVLAMSTSAFDLGVVEPNSVHSRRVVFENKGSEILHIDLVPSSPHIAVSDESFDVSPGDEKGVTFDLTAPDGSGEAQSHVVVYSDEGTTSVDFRLDVQTTTNISGAEVLPSEYALHQNYPNPFNPTTQIRYQLPEASNVRIGVYNALGQLVQMLVNTEMPAGFHATNWDGRDVSGTKVATGLYFYRLVTPKFTKTQKMLLAK